MINLDYINSLAEPEARAAFLKCCGAPRWAERMALRRPYSTEAELMESARQIWRALERADWLQAFAAHPKIGEGDGRPRSHAPAWQRRVPTPERGNQRAMAAWAAAEQAGVAGAPDTVLQALADGNHAYEATFGYIFIICASGKTAGEMLALLNQRLKSSPEEELQTAALEQEKITLLRLQKMTP
jgi:2-oxo-4-hydroxy-4-carboxy-5-ureidoimidazoline decarboxylase